MGSVDYLLSLPQADNERRDLTSQKRHWREVSLFLRDKRGTGTRNQCSASHLIDTVEIKHTPSYLRLGHPSEAVAPAPCQRLKNRRVGRAAQNIYGRVDGPTPDGPRVPHGRASQATGPCLVWGRWDA